MFPNDLFEPPTKFKIGFPDEYAATADGMVNEKFKTSSNIQLEIERQRELKKIYEKRRDLNVEIEVLDEDEPPPPGN